MTWVRVDDTAGDHPKLKRLSLPARWLWFSGLCYSARHLTDGHLSSAEVRDLAVVVADDWRRLVAELTTPQVKDKAPLWETNGDDGGVVVHDFLVYNPPAAEVIAGREEAKERMRAHRALDRLGVHGPITRGQLDELPADLRPYFVAGPAGLFVRSVSRRAARGSTDRSAEHDAERTSERATDRSAVPSPSPSPSRPVPDAAAPKRPPRAATAGGGTLLDDAGGIDGRRPTARWAAKAERPKSVSPRDLEAAVVRALREMRLQAVVPDKCATAAASVLSLWRALAFPAVDAFAGELVLVARAAQMSSDRIFARDVRAEGWKEGTPRTFHVATLCVHARWDDRLLAARRFAEQSGRVGAGGVAVARRQRWPDPHDPSSWQMLDDRETMLASYVRLAEGLLQGHVDAERRAAPLERLRALSGLPGADADLSKVVRLALDEAGEW